MLVTLVGFLLFPLLVQLLILFFDQTLEFALLEVTNKYLPLLAIVHLTELPEFVLLEDTKGSEVRRPLLFKLLHLLIILLLIELILLIFKMSVIALANRNESSIDPSLIILQRSGQTTNSELPLPEALLGELDLNGFL